MPILIDPVPAEAANIYNPYYAVARRNLLPYAIGLFKKMNFEGQRTIEGGDPVKFIASWQGGSLPVDQALCQVKFGNDPQQYYEMSLTNYELIEFLMDVVVEVQRGNEPCFSTAFFKKLMRREDITAAL